MATITVAHKPDLTAERAMDAFRTHFADKYKVYETRFWKRGRDFIVEKSGWTGVGIKLKQESDATTFVFTPIMPSMILQLSFGGLIAMLFLRPGHKAMEDEVRTFIDNAAAFR